MISHKDLQDLIDRIANEEGHNYPTVVSWQEYLRLKEEKESEDHGH